MPSERCVQWAMGVEDWGAPSFGLHLRLSSKLNISLVLMRASTYKMSEIKIDKQS
jgi:hypothetical protein